MKLGSALFSMGERTDFPPCLGEGGHSVFRLGGPSGYHGRSKERRQGLVDQGGPARTNMVETQIFWRNASRYQTVVIEAPSLRT